MTRRLIGGTLSAAAGLFVGTGPALAQGTFDIEHCITLGPIIPAFFCMNGTHPYGTTSLVTDGSGREWWATSPAPGGVPGYDSSMLCDFTGLNMYWKSDMTLSGIDDPVEPGSPILFNSAGVQIGTAGGSGDTITLSFFTTEIETGPEPKAVVAWNTGIMCYPDCNLDSVLTIADFGCFQTKFVAGDLYADCNGVGGLTIADFGCFQTSFVAGCP